MPELDLQPSLQQDARSQALRELVQRLKALDLSSLLVYRIDSVPASALDALAWQFDLISPLWQLLLPQSPGQTTEQLQRTLIKSTVPLHRRLGTPSAIKDALASLGFLNVTILEGQDKWGGSSWPPDEGWAVCRLVIQQPVLNPDLIRAWNDTDTFSSRSAVSYNGKFFFALQDAGAGRVPQFLRIDDVPDLSLINDFDNLVQDPWILLSSSAPDYNPYQDWPQGSVVSWQGSLFLATADVPLVPQFDGHRSPSDAGRPLTRMGVLEAPWVPTTVGPLLRPVLALDLLLIVEVFNFFKNERSWLDSVIFALAPFCDPVIDPDDFFDISGDARVSEDAGPAPDDSTVTLSITLPPFVDNYGPIVPLYNGHYQHDGVTYGENEPQVVADSAVTLNGVEED